MNTSQYKNFDNPDETRTFGHGRMEVITSGGNTIGRATMEPGWRWSNDVKPIAGTEWCEAAHFLCLLSGRLHIKMASGEEFELGPGDVATIAPGHDAWVVGDEPVTSFDWTGAANYAKPGAKEEKISKAA